MAGTISAREPSGTLAPWNQAVLDCCVTLGYDARSTEGNARESLRWLGENNFTTIRLVTANYHMNRSLLEFRRVMPQITVIPNPVFPRQVQDPYWFARPGTVILLFNEYHKYLVAAARVKISDMGNSIAGFSNRVETQPLGGYGLPRP